MIAHHFDQLRSLHRNPLVHPEVTLDMTEAQSLWAMCTSPSYFYGDQDESAVESFGAFRISRMMARNLRIPESPSSLCWIEIAKPFSP